MWQVVMPVKRWDLAKSRLALPSTLRRRLVQAMAADTLAAVRACPSVNRVTVLASDSSVAPGTCLAAADQVLVQPPGLTLSEAVAWAALEVAAPGSTGTAVVMADLPALRPAELTPALAAAARFERAMVVDRHDTGTTLLTATGGAALVARLGPQSAEAHRQDGVCGLTEHLEGLEVAGLRCDVDTVADLRVATGLGLGTHTTVISASLGSPT